MISVLVVGVFVLVGFMVARRAMSGPNSSRQRGREGDGGSYASTDGGSSDTAHHPKPHEHSHEPHDDGGSTSSDFDGGGSGDSGGDGGGGGD